MNFKEAIKKLKNEYNMIITDSNESIIEFHFNLEGDEEYNIIIDKINLEISTNLTLDFELLHIFQTILWALKTKGVAK